MWRIFRKKTQEERELDELSKRIKSDKLDMSGIFSNLNKRKEIDELYSELSRRAHPDRFVGDDEKIAKAEIIFKKIQENQTDYQSLLALKTEVDKLYEL